LSYLREFPVSTLKVDRSFIRDLSLASNNRRLVEAIIAMAHGLDLMTIAEGVETEEQFQLMAELKCDMVQGYFFSEAVTADQIKKLIGGDRPKIRVVHSI
jgi:EAL domain-containing protein (putative c-di-GMP-specific phosphodiesterase class I)